MDGSSSHLIFLLTIFHCYTVDLLHGDTSVLQILSLHVIFKLDFLPGLMPFLNCFKVWVGAFTHSLKQYMWKSKQLIFMPKYCYTHCSSFQGCTKIYTGVTIGCRVCFGKKGDLLVKLRKEQQRVSEQRVFTVLLTNCKVAESVTSSSQPPFIFSSAS